MNFFSALRTAEFSTQLLAAAGFDIAAAREANTPNALKDWIDSKVSAAANAEREKCKGALEEAVAKSADSATQIEVLNAALKSAKQEYDAKFAALDAIGFAFPESAENEPAEEQLVKNKAALEKHIKMRAQSILGASGVPPIVDGSKNGTQSSSTMFGRDRYKADFERQIAILYTKRN